MARLHQNSPDQDTSLALLDRDLEIVTKSGPFETRDGEVLVVKNAVLQLHLDPPLKGLQRDGGEDGVVIRIVSVTPFAHVLKCPRGFNGEKDKAKPSNAVWAPNVGNTLDLIAYDGDWYTLAAVGVSLVSMSALPAPEETVNA